MTREVYKQRRSAALIEWCGLAAWRLTDGPRHAMPFVDRVSLL